VGSSRAIETGADRVIETGADRVIETGAGTGTLGPTFGWYISDGMGPTAKLRLDTKGKGAPLSWTALRSDESRFFDDDAVWRGTEVWGGTSLTGSEESVCNVDFPNILLFKQRKEFAMLPFSHWEETERERSAAFLLRTEVGPTWLAKTGVSSSCEAANEPYKRPEQQTTRRNTQCLMSILVSLAPSLWQCGEFTLCAFICDPNILTRIAVEAVGSLKCLAS
jgi:hypothetical protein